MAYTGGKGRAYQFLINLMPPHRVYIETHLGAGAVLRHKRPAARNVGIDKDRRVLENWPRRTSPPVDLVEGDAVEYLRDLRPAGDELVFADPPYLPRHRRRRRCYRYDYDVSDHERLLERLTRLPCRVMITGVPDALYDDALAGWCRRDYVNLTHVGPRHEAVWLNFTPGPVLHDYRYIGDTFRERERFRRRRESLVRRVGAISPLERNAALSDFADYFPDALRDAAARVTAQVAP